MCQFHQIKIIDTYLTKHPELPASIELQEIAHLLTKTNKESFVCLLDSWYEHWESFLKERSKDPNNTYYTHKRLRSTYLSLKWNMPWLDIL